MNDITYNICIVSPAGYAHAAVFLEVAEALTYSMRELGHPVTLQVNNVEMGSRNIIIGAQLLTESELQRLPGNTIILNTEQLTASDAFWRDRLAASFRSGLEFWDYSETNVAAAKSMGCDNIKLLKFGYQPQLNRIAPAAEQDVDVLFYGSPHPRRTRILDGLRRRGLEVKELMGVYSRNRDAWIARSRVVLNVHYYDSQIFEVVRAFYLLSNGIALATELNPATRIEERFAAGIVGAPYETLVDEVEALVRDRDRLAAQRQAALDSIAAYPQAEFTRQVLAA